MSVSNRIIAGFTAITAILVLLGVYAMSQVGSVRQTVDTIVARDVAAMRQLDGITAAVSQMAEDRTIAVRQFALGAAADDRDPIERWREQFGTANTAAAALRRSTAQFADDAVTGGRAEQWRAMQANLDALIQALAATRSDVETQLAAMRRGDRATILAQEPRIRADRGRMLDDVAQVRAVLDQTISVGRSDAAVLYATSRISILLAMLIGVVVAVVVAWSIRRSVLGPLSAFIDFAETVGAGHLSAKTAEGADELGRLGVELNRMVDSLRLIARKGREATENLNAAATEIRASTQEQAASVEEQLAAVQETAATVDEITHSGSQISRRAQEVIAAAQATVQTSEAGVAAGEDTVKAMDAIREQAEAVAGNIVQLSEKAQAIGDIIGTVNDVSERTHLLALNASIEAAAAGEAGRSFAIVAAEMKTLADAAKEATRSVRGILGDVQRGINASVMLTEEAVKRVASGKERIDISQSAIEELSARVQESVQTFQQIVASTNQQQIGIEQVTIALQNIRQASQQTAASTRQLDQAAADLTGLSRTLVSLTEHYRL